MAMRDECRGELSIAPKNERLKRASTDMNSATKMRFVIPALALGVLLADNAEELEHPRRGPGRTPPPSAWRLSL